MRILIIILNFCLIMLAPWWIYLPALFISVFKINFFAESIAFGFLIDVLYGSALYKGSFFSYPFALTLLVLVLALVPIKNHLRLNV